VPFSVHSYTGTFLQNQQALTLTDLLDSDAPVVSDPSSSKASPWNDTFQSRAFLNTIWKNAPDGIPGNDDLGEMSSWAVFAMMGFYPEIPGRAELVLGSPLFTSVTVHRANGDVHVIVPAAATNTPYVQAVKVDGKPSSKTWLPESFALKGGTLEFDLSNTPSKSWGTHPGDEPPSFGAN
jgi:putative alpha-1,2-mannosidase